MPRRPGYGSLVHTPGFRFRRRVEGYISGYRRVFWQGSTDHRGTPEAPGRTVTLAPEAGAITWGVAFELDGTDEEVAQAVQYLEWREKQYDQRKLVDVRGRGGELLVAGALCYIATKSPANKNWLGPAPLPAIAAQIASSRGPSGPNCNYVYRLAAVMRDMGVDDKELFDLEGEVRRLVAAAAAAAAAQEEEAAAARRRSLEGWAAGGGKGGGRGGAVSLDADARGGGGGGGSMPEAHSEAFARWQQAAAGAPPGA
ncbi:MAG: ChaC-like protein-domain-containing protein [Monoraphidium minutum]|nr:MAG: ChaC-like protein-domain-containing protein [Monoraphidium minutum]